MTYHCSYCGNGYPTQHRMTMHRTKCSIRKTREQIEMQVACQPQVTQVASQVSSQMNYSVTYNAVVVIGGTPVSDDHFKIFRQKFLEILVNLGPYYMADGRTGLDEFKIRMYEHIVNYGNPAFTAIAEVLLRRVKVSESDFARIVALEQELIDVWKDVIPADHPDFQEMVENLEYGTVISVVD